MPVTIAHLADLHLGLSRYNLRAKGSPRNQREMDVQAAFDVTVDYLLQARPDLVLVCGDALDRFHIGTAAELGAVRSFRRMIDAGLQVVVVGGNHDQPSAEGSDISLGHLMERGISVVLDQESMDVGGVRLHAVSYRALAASYRGEALRPLPFSSSLPNVFATHGYAPGKGVTFPPQPVEVPAEMLADERYALICLGHLHLHAEIAPRVFYSGALERVDFGEQGCDPAFWMHTIDGGRLSESRSVRVADLGAENVPRPMHRARVDASHLTLQELSAQVESSLPEWAAGGGLCSLELIDVSTEFSRRQLRDEWERAFRELGGVYLKVDARPRSVVEFTDVRFSSLTTNISEAFETFLQAQESLGEGELDELHDLGMRAFSVAHDQLAREAVK